MKYTWPTPEDPTPPIFYSLALGVLLKVPRKICVTQHKRYQHVGIFASGDAKVPNANGFVSQWNIGFNLWPFVLIIICRWALDAAGSKHLYALP